MEMNTQQICINDSIRQDKAARFASGDLHMSESELFTGSTSSTESIVQRHSSCSCWNLKLKEIQELLWNSSRRFQLVLSSYENKLFEQSDLLLFGPTMYARAHSSQVSLINSVTRCYPRVHSLTASCSWLILGHNGLKFKRQFDWCTSNTSFFRLSYLRCKPGEASSRLQVQQYKISNEIFPAE